MRFGSVCSGIEAASVAFGPLGWKAAWFAEVEPFPSAVLAHHYPETPNLGDMTAISRRVLTGEVEAPDVLCGGTPCFTAGHMVITQRGYVPIDEIVVGDMVVTHKGRLRRVVRIGSKIARVGRLSGVGLGEKISCTPDHPFRSVEWRMQNTKRGNKYERVEHIGDPSWTAAKDMPGSQWCALTAVSVDAPVMPDGIDADELLYIAGFYLGDGFIRRWADANKKAVVFGVNDEKVDRFKARVTQSVSVLRERTGPRIVLGNTAIADWLIENFGEYSHAKTLPAWVLAHPQRAALMDGYRDTDGHCTANGWRAISVSRALAYGMRDLAQTLGMVASVAFTKVDPTKTIEGRKVNQRDYWTVTAFNGETSRKSRIRHGMLLRTVSAFEEVGDETVFNIEVDEDHSYVLDGVIVHNCQAFSVAGLRQSLDDARGNLTLKFVEIADAIDHVRVTRGDEPAIVFWENVPGVLSTKDNAFGCFLAGLAGEDEPLQPPGEKWANAGCVYGPARAIAWRVLDAQYFQLAQRRRRVFVVASARDGFDPATVLFEWDGMRRDSPPSREAREGSAAGTLRSTDGGSDVDHALAGHIQPVICMAHGQGGAEVASERRTTLTCNHEAPIVATCVTGDITHTLRAEGFDASEDGTGRGQPIVVVHGTQDPCVSADTAFALGRNNGGENVIAFDATQITSSANRSNPNPGDPCHPLAAGAHAPAVAVSLRGREGGATAELGDEVQNCLRASGGGGDKAYVLTFSCKDYGGDVGPVSPTLRSMGHDGGHANGGGQVAVAFAQNSRDEVRLMNGDGQIVGALAAEPGMKQTCYVAQYSELEALYNKGFTTLKEGNASTQETYPGTLLRTLRQEVGEEAFAKWGLGILDSLQQAEVLRQALHGLSIRPAAFSRSWVVHCALSRSENRSGWLLQSLREAGCERCASQGWEPSEQLARQLGAYLSELSRPGAQAARFVRDLWFASEGVGLLQQALLAVQEVGRPAGRQGQSVLRGSEGRGSEESEVVPSAGMQCEVSRERLLHEACTAGEARDSRKGTTEQERSGKGWVGETPFAVRRLTVEECEFLQGFPRGYSKIPWRKKPASDCPDGPRYKALGNSWAVTVVSWIGRRIQEAINGNS